MSTGKGVATGPGVGRLYRGYPAITNSWSVSTDSHFNGLIYKVSHVKIEEQVKGRLFADKPVYAGDEGHNYKAAISKSLSLEVNRDEYNSVNNGRRARRTFLA